MRRKNYLSIDRFVQYRVFANSLFFIVFFSLFTISCEKDEIKYHKAKVLGVGIDCGDSYLIEFDDYVEGLPESIFGNIFYEINLPDIYKVEGKMIEVIFREPRNDEFMGCTMFGPTYPQIFIIKVK